MGENKEIAQQRKQFAHFPPEVLLDSTLKCLTVASSGGITMKSYVNSGDLYHFLSIDYDINLHAGEYEAIINKLEKDGYVITEMMTSDRIITPTTHHILTFEGLFFISKGGYTQEKIDKEKENIRQKEESKELKKLSKRSGFWTIITGVVGGLFFIFEVYKYFNSDCPK